MKKILQSLLLLILICSTCTLVMAQVKISALPGTPHPAALLDLESNNGGLLLPRLTTGEMGNVSTNAQSKGLLIFNTDSNSLFVFDGLNWRPVQYVSPVSQWLLGGNSNINAANQFIGTIDSVDLNFRTNNRLRFTVKANGLTGIGTGDPISALDIVAFNKSDAADDINIRTYSNAAGPALLLYRARTAGSVPANLQNGDFLGILNFGGEVNGNNTGLSSIIANYTGNGTTTLSSLSLRTSGNQGMFLNDKGWLTIGNNSQSAGATADIQGSLRYKFSTPTGNTLYTLTNTDLMVIVTEGVGPNTIALPASGDFDGHFIIIKNNKLTAVSISAGTSVLTCNGGGTGCSSLGAQRVIGLVGQFNGNTMNWIQIF